MKNATGLGYMAPFLTSNSNESHMPHFYIICCEGKTEKKYFEILKSQYRFPGYVTFTIVGEKGQHMALIDRTVELREEIIADLELDNDEIESWAVCDHDKMSCTYSELEHYATDRNVNLAFSKPQFESFLLQHFEQSKATKSQELFSRLTFYKQQLGYTEPYDESTKSDLAWLDDALFNKPSLVEVAIVNSDLRSRSTGNPFLTVQRLVKLLRSLRKE